MASLMNGLSALGGSVAQFAGNAGLELQKSQLAQQQAVLADQLATTRETTLQASGGAIAAAAADKAQTFQAGQNTQQQAAEADRQKAALAVTQSEGSANRAAQVALESQRENAPPEQVKLLRALGVQLPGDPAPSGGSATTTITPGGSAGGSTPPLPGPRATGGIAADGSLVAPSGGSTSDASASGGSAPPAGSGTIAGGAAPSGASATPMVTALINKTLGLPAPGSAEATRYAIASDVKADPAFKYKTAGQQAAETELRVAVAEGKMTDPVARTPVATAIASYALKPLDGYALTKPGGPETMAEVMRINPDYQEGRFPEVNKAMSAFGTGQQGNIIRSLNVGVQHLATLDQAGQALGNGDVQGLNSLKNMFRQQFGASAPTTFDALKQIVGTEVEKAVAGGIGSAGDRDRIMESLKSANSPAQLQAVTDGFRSLMVGQLSGLKTQYEDATGFKDGRFAFETKLSPETTQALQSRTGGTGGQALAPAAAPSLPAWVRPGDQYSPSRGQARAPDGSVYGAPVSSGAMGLGG